MAKAELGEDEGRLAADIATLRWEIKNDLFQVHKKYLFRDWVKKSPHLQKIRTDDAFLTLFLRFYRPCEHHV